MYLSSGVPIPGLLSFPAFKIQITQTTHFSSFVKFKVHVYLLKIAISKLIILRCQTKYKQ